MWNGRIAELFAQEGLTVSDYFDGIVTSFQAGCCKPDPAIFRKVTDEFGIRPNETMFFDDSEANCRKADTLGFHSVHVPQGTDFTDLIPPR